MDEEPPDCKYQTICRYYNNCKPIQVNSRDLDISDCWIKNTLDGLIKTEWEINETTFEREIDLVDNKKFKGLRIYFNKDLGLG